ncbi:flagellar hook-associated protein 3 FlgL [Devosia sp. YR412]|uniref:flagellin n=1 Tax=Devosia sp. YR412 TaxID=1881030 RepID=UPI0008ABA5D9|nr:flagellin [Devosia sp. YR412]SEQ52239.1 flagellar hook-associated protein 3 FlgL [Devosia sp. YR412]
MTMRVATFAMNRQMLAASLNTQAKMAGMQLQEASGLASTDYTGLGTDARKLVNLEVSAARSSRYEAAASNASTTIEATYNALGSIADLLSSFRSQVTAAQGINDSAATRATLVASATASLAELGSLLNTQYGDRSIFAGSDGNGAAVDISAISFDLDTVDTSYYQGSAGRLTAQISENQTLTYGINADAIGIEQALRAIGSVAQSGDGADLDLSAVLELLVQATDGVATLQGTTSIAAASAERAIATQQDLQDFYNNSISSLRDVDVTAIAAQLTAYETQLQASYAALAKLQSLSILDYLR